MQRDQVVLLGTLEAQGDRGQVDYQERQVLLELRVSRELQDPWEPPEMWEQWEPQEPRDHLEQ